MAEKESGARKYPLKLPKNHRPPIPRWKLDLPDENPYIYTLYIGVQRHSNSPVSIKTMRQAEALIKAWVAEETKASSLTSESFSVMNGDVHGSSAWVCYWSRKEEYEHSINRISLRGLYFALPTHDRETIGLWCESFSTAASRLETNYTGLDYLPGLGQLPGSTTSEHDLTAYWGAARDRIPDSAHDLFECENASITNAPTSIPRGLGQHLLGQNYKNMVHIRSGQFWESCSALESQAYEEKLEPALENGLQYLWENPTESGAIGVRYLRNTEKDDSKRDHLRKETCAAGFFRSLQDLEHWAKVHPSHLKIYRGALQHAKAFGVERKFRTWHEVSVLEEKQAKFEYVNCRPETGAIRFVALQDSGLETQ